MRLESLLIENFRCLGRLERELPPGRILIVGDNARGKTTLLEALFYLVTGRSFRTRYDNEVVPWKSPGGTVTAVRGQVRRAEGDTCRLAVTIADGAKTVRIDEQPLERLAGLWGRLRAVLFTPDDLQLIKGPPGDRRRYLDMALSQISPDFLFHLQRYNQALRQRNALLKRADLGMRLLKENIGPWDTQLAEHGVPVLRMRSEFLEALEPRAARLYQRIAVGDGEGGEQLRLRYVSSLKIDLAEPPEKARLRFHEILSESLEDDMRRGQTETGPHRDDFAVTLSGKTARDFASQGQVRSCVVALRLAEASEMEHRTAEPPLVLLDDLASELDPGRKEHVLALLKPQWQTFLTTTRREDFPPESDFDAVISLPL
ncbi:DNA replication/repair protein RecF [bacterium]|nr:DNA replication/repair protein RecF [bacterium]